MVLPVVDELLAALNDGFNPYVDQIRASDLQVLVRNSDGSYSCLLYTSRPFTLDEQRQLVELCEKGIRQLQAVQKEILGV